MSRLTVKELIERLQRMPQEAEVYTEGCDCFGDAVDVKLGTDGNVTIMREVVEAKQAIF